MQKSHNLTLDDWVDGVWNASTNLTVYEKLRQLESFQFTLLFSGSEKSMLKGGKSSFYVMQFKENKL